MMKNKFNECKGCINEHGCKYAGKFQSCIYRYCKNNTGKSWTEFYMKRFTTVK